MLKRYAEFFVVVFLFATLSMLVGGCSQKSVRTDEGTDSSKADSASQQDTTQVQPVQPVGTEESLDSGASDNMSDLDILEGRTTGPMLPIYYDFDKSGIRLDQKSRVENNAVYLKDNPQARIVIEGNCDERGTNEYNMALGERRAISAKKYIVNLGVAANRVNTISYGEERPLNHGHDELAWSQNRRGDFVQIR